MQRVICLAEQVASITCNSCSFPQTSPFCHSERVSKKPKVRGSQPGWFCHSERSEESVPLTSCVKDEILRFAQNDKTNRVGLPPTFLPPFGHPLSEAKNNKALLGRLMNIGIAICSPQFVRHLCLRSASLYSDVVIMMLTQLCFTKRGLRRAYNGSASRLAGI